MPARHIYLNAKDTAVWDRRVRSLRREQSPTRSMSAFVAGLLRGLEQRDKHNQELHGKRRGK